MYYNGVCYCQTKEKKHKISDGEMSQVIATDNISRR